MLMIGLTKFAGKKRRDEDGGSLFLSSAHLSQFISPMSSISPCKKKDIKESDASIPLDKILRNKNT
jgi:hypothetical protein